MKRKSAILQMWHGERGHFEAMPCRRTKDYYKWLEEEHRIHDELEEKLAPEIIKVIDKMIDAIESKNVEEMEGHFLEGFKFGMQIGMEAISQDSDEKD